MMRSVALYVTGVSLSRIGTVQFYKYRVFSDSARSPAALLLFAMNEDMGVANMAMGASADVASGSTQPSSRDGERGTRTSL